MTLAQVPVLSELARPKHRIIGQVFVPGLIGPAIGAWVLRDADVLINDDGTESFLPDKGIWAAALVIIVLLVVVLFLTMRRNEDRR